MESIDSHIPKKSKHIGFSDKHCALCMKHGGPHKSHNTHDCHKNNSNGLSKGMGVQEVHKRMDMLIRTIQIRENAKDEIMLS
jgi:hypothetical protein